MRKGDGYLICWVFSHMLTLVGFFHCVVYMTNIYLVGLCVCRRVGGDRRATKKHLRSFLSVFTCTLRFSILVYT